MTRHDGGPADGGTSRRRVIAAVGSGLVGGSLSGCLSSDTVDGEVVDDPRVFALPFPHVPETVQLNPWTGSYPSDFETLFFESPSLRSPGGDRELAPLVEAVTIEGATARVTYADGFTWWNGEPVAARDRLVDERIRSYVEGADGPATGGGAGAVPARGGGVQPESVSLSDERTLVYEFDAAYDRPLVLDRVVGRAHKVAAWRFGDRAEALEDASTADDVAGILEDLREDRLSLPDAMDAGYGCGPFELVEVSVNRLVMDPFPDHPAADAVEVPRLWLPVGMDQQTRSLIARGVVDGGRGHLDDLAIEPAENLEQLASYPTGVGRKLVCNWHDDHLGRPEVRRALAAVLPLDRIVEQAGWGQPATIQTGMTAPLAERWLGADIRESLHRYPIGRDDERAADHLRAASYERDTDDRWVDADDEPLRLSVIAPTWPEWGSAMDDVASVLEDFGVDVDFTQYTGGTFVTDVQSGAFDLAPWVTDGRPHRAYDLPATEVATLGFGVDGDGETTPFGKPLRGSLPRTPGDVTAGPDEREEVDLLAAWERIRARTAAAETREAVATMATWWNAQVPDVDLATGTSGVWGNTRDFAWPPEGDSDYARYGSAGRPDVQLLRSGAVRPATGEGST